MTSTEHAVDMLTVTVGSIDGDAEFASLDELLAEAPTDWSDEKPMPVWQGDNRIGTLDPGTGEFERTALQDDR